MLFAALLLLCSMSVPALAADITYVDVAADAPYAEGVRYLSECVIIYSGSARHMEVFRETPPQPYAYFQALADRNWGI